MSYIGWRKDNEETYIDILRAPEGIAPCFRESSTNPEIINITNTVVEQIMSNKKINIGTFPYVFAEYLYEEYKVKPADLEIMCLTIYKLLMRQTREIAEKAAMESARATFMAIMPNVEEDANDSKGSNSG